ncbi:MAG: hypothetical protein GY795_37415 [Desulfobacterales bacterium]|nr:hypothetical protein [Desulfobacterales bacterium]
MATRQKIFSAFFSLLIIIAVVEKATSSDKTIDNSGAKNVKLTITDCVNNEEIIKPDISELKLTSGYGIVDIMWKSFYKIKFPYCDMISNKPDSQITEEVIDDCLSNKITLYEKKDGKPIKLTFKYFMTKNQDNLLLKGIISETNIPIYYHIIRIKEIVVDKEATNIKD